MGRLLPIHPGEVLREEFLRPWHLLPEQLAQGLGISREAVQDLLDEKALLTAELALLLGRYFTTTPEFWLNLQQKYELEQAKDQLDGELEDIEPWSP